MRIHFLLFGLICSLAVHAGERPLTGSAACLECHEEINGFFQKGAHRSEMFLGKVGRGCESCHGSGSAHVESGEAADIWGGRVLKGWSDEQRSKACLSCHQENIHGWSLTPHAVELSCWDCHGEALHFQNPEKQKRAACAECHRGMAMRTELQYRHPVACEDCHDIHGEKRRAAVANSRCLSCHKEYQGPYIYDHAALEEGCQVCHEPHGSSTRKLLKMTGNGLCLQCHTQSNFPAIGKKIHSPQLSGGAFCYDCHTDMHGSNTSPNLIRRLR
ncbi:MAG: cytochrome c3 family protein [Candidatus Aminicenantales bacterium]